ncbi:MAG: hypothetical protein JSU07_08470 [Bacteroidetes bacterium]|nr:hypothetical protein [Bacteroidota bacterium]
MLFTFYVIVFSALIYYTNVFGIISNSSVTKKWWLILFWLKIIAIPIFYFIYEKYYGGINNFDSGKFFNDSLELKKYASINFSGYLKALFGFQNDAEGSEFYNHYIEKSSNWDKGQVANAFFYDNRTVIRLNSILQFIIFNNYSVSALFNCFMSYIGISALFKTFETTTTNKHKFVLLFCVMLFPTLWLYTASVSKESIAILVIGLLLYQTNKLINTSFKTKNQIVLNIITIIFLCYLSFFIKPYYTLTMYCFYVLYKFYDIKIKNKYSWLLFIFTIIPFFIFGNIVYSLLKNKSLYQSVINQQHVFYGAAEGGIFLINDTKFIRLKYDSTQIKLNASKFYSIKKNVPYMYWMLTNLNDTLYCNSNTDTTSNYKIQYIIKKNGSNIKMSNKGFSLLFQAIKYSLFYPIMPSSFNPMQLAVVLENVATIICITLLIIGFSANNNKRLIITYFMVSVLVFCIFIGATAPNTGAIVRYRSLVMPFLYFAVFCINIKPLKKI